MPALATLPWLLLAVVALALGVVGIVLPGLPTTPFVLLSAWAATRGSPRLHAWLRRQRLVGPVLRAWEAQHAIPRRAKVAASAAMAVCVGLLFALVRPLWWPALGSLTMALVARWIWTRPDGSD